jgi:hypothetical protein
MTICSSDGDFEHSSPPCGYTRVNRLCRVATICPVGCFIADTAPSLLCGIVDSPAGLAVYAALHRSSSYATKIVESLECDQL